MDVLYVYNIEEVERGRGIISVNSAAASDRYKGRVTPEEPMYSQPIELPSAACTTWVHPSVKDVNTS